MRTAIVVDDEPITRLDLTEMLKELDFSVLCDASDGFDAVELCRINHPDVVLMDIKMPVFDGLSAAETIISEDLCGCVVMLTAFCDKELIDRASKIGVYGYLVKPIDQRALLPAIEVALSQSERLHLSRLETNLAKNKLQEKNLIDRAKALLAETLHISESKAYTQLQSLAMNKRIPLSQIALTIVKQGSEREVINRTKEKLMNSEGISEKEAFAYIQKYAKSKGVSPSAAAIEIFLKK